MTECIRAGGKVTQKFLISFMQIPWMALSANGGSNPPKPPSHGLATDCKMLWQQKSTQRDRIPRWQLLSTHSVPAVSVAECRHRNDEKDNLSTGKTCQVSWSIMLIKTKQFSRPPKTYETATKHWMQSCRPDIYYCQCHIIYDESNRSTNRNNRLIDHVPNTLNILWHPGKFQPPSDHSTTNFLHFIRLVIFINKIIVYIML